MLVYIWLKYDDYDIIVA